jgi:hypothetical protein
VSASKRAKKILKALCRELSEDDRGNTTPEVWFQSEERRRNSLTREEETERYWRENSIEVENLPDWWRD